MVHKDVYFGAAQPVTHVQDHKVKYWDRHNSAADY